MHGCKKKAKNVLRKIIKKGEATSGHVAARESEYRSGKKKKKKNPCETVTSGGGHIAAKGR